MALGKEGSKVRKKRDPASLDEALRKAAEEHEQAKRRVEERLDDLVRKMRDSDPLAPDGGDGGLR